MLKFAKRLALWVLFTTCATCGLIFLVLLTTPFLHDHRAALGGVALALFGAIGLQSGRILWAS